MGISIYGMDESNSISMPQKNKRKIVRDRILLLCLSRPKHKTKAK